MYTDRRRYSVRLYRRLSPGSDQLFFFLGKTLVESRADVAYAYDLSVCVSSHLLWHLSPQLTTFRCPCLTSQSGSHRIYWRTYQPRSLFFRDRFHAPSSCSFCGACISFFARKDQSTFPFPRQEEVDLRRLTNEFVVFHGKLPESFLHSTEERTELQLAT